MTPNSSVDMQMPYLGMQTTENQYLDTYSWQEREQSPGDQRNKKQLPYHPQRQNMCPYPKQEGKQNGYAAYTKNLASTKGNPP
jgi:hypothetical protein